MSLYLKYRPENFDNLVWQDFINNTLKVAIEKWKTVWAYLFCWPRWTWKTSTARLLAKSINCLNTNKWNPCLECEICKWFKEGSLVDIIEIDAASHTWVENIRGIIEKANFTPSITNYKVYIIDEVHMLSKWAFNALLKILEEPPKHLKFILATTEKHKVPDTIISRCQVYNFSKIDKDTLISRINYIAKCEDVKIDSESLEYIYKSSDWWLRDAISLFEQLIEWWKIKYSSIEEKLWIVAIDIYNSFYSKLLIKDSSVINDYENIISSWKNIKLFFKDLIFFIKDIAVKDLKSWKNITNALDILDKLDSTYSKIKSSLDEKTTFLIWILSIINNSNSEVDNTTMQAKKDTSTKEQKVEKKVEKNIREELKSDDIWDIFSNNIQKEIIRETPKNDTNNSNFDKEKFISKLKENWAKWWLTMSIRWSSIEIEDSNLILKFWTSFALNQTNTSENIALLNKSLNDLWLDYNIKMN